MRLSMKKEVSELLTSWGLDEADVAVFIDNEMDLFAIQIMDKETLIELLPRVGVRIRFEAKRKQWINSLEGEAQTQPPSPDKTLHVSKQQEAVTIALESSEMATNIPDVLMEGDECNTNAYWNERQDILLNGGVLIAKGEDLKPVTTINNSSTKSCKADSASGDLLTNAMSLNTSHGHEAYDLIKVLQSCVPEGLGVLSKYAKDKQFLKDSTRDELVSCIVNNELKQDMAAMASRSRMKIIAEKIVATFPTEQESAYFVSYKNPKTGKVCAKGKLVFKFYNTRRKYLACGAIPYKNVRKTPTEEGIPGNSMDADYEEISGSLCWLEENSGDN